MLFSKLFDQNLCLKYDFYVIIPNAMYSASVDDKHTVVCIFNVKYVGDPPIVATPPVMLFLSFSLFA